MAARFARDQRGVSAVEFALVAPLMITLYLGCVEISQGVGVDRKVTLTAAHRRRTWSCAGRRRINNRRHDQYPQRVDRGHRALFDCPSSR